MLGDDLLSELGGRIPSDHSRQTLADDYIPRIARGRVVDLGCGPGDSVDQFRAVNPSVEWIGIDIERSPEVARRTRTDAEFMTFDGTHIPVDDVDAVYCKQTLEHVRAPLELLRDVARVLRPGGLLAGSTSQLEPFHSLSVSNATPYGLALLCDEAGLELEELRPGIDGLTLVAHRALGMSRVTRRFWAHESPLNRAIEAVGRVRGLGAARVNAAKLVVCGQFAFLARRPG